MSKFNFYMEAQTSGVSLDRAERCADVLAPALSKLGPTASLADVDCGDEKLGVALRTRRLEFSYSGFDLPEDLQRLGWVNYLSEQEMDAELVKAGSSIDGRIVISNGKTVLWLCS